jgi:ribonucleoside-diphosphate reductase alpha chain
MGQKGKFLVMEDGQLDLTQYVLDDHRFTDILMREKVLDPDQAMAISRFLRLEIEKLEPHTITVPFIEQLIEAKFLEYGLMFRRVASHIASAEKNYGDETRVREVADVFYQLMAEAKFLPNSPTLMNAGRRLGQLAACFVLPVEDSMEGIFDTLMNAAIIHKSGGGTGFPFRACAPRTAMVGTTGGVASGPVSFMKIFNTATEQVKQGGTRRGANMAILRVDHPDILEFITCKQDKMSLNNFNISVGVTDAFMQAVQAGAAYDLIDPRDGRKVSERLEARRGLQPDDGAGLGQRRPRHHLSGPHQPRQPHPRAGGDRKHQPLRRAAAAAHGGLQPGLHQPGAVRRR